MSTTFYHRPHHARVHFDGKFTWNAALDLVETLDTVIETYRYDAVELVVTSPGADTDALAHVLTSLRERQANGVMFQTRVVSYAASAAAVLATAGDFRTAAEGAKLLFHGVRSGQGEAMTARVARAVAQQVERINHVLLDNMVGGVLLAAPCPPPAAIAQPGDRPVLEALWPIVSPKRRARRPRALQALVEATCAYVGRAVAAEDIGALQRLYRRLLPEEIPISADLAQALGLIDWVGPAASRVPAEADEPGIVVPEWQAIFPDGLVPRSVLTRHILALGETGSGKTRSVVMPVAAALVIDPKGELLPLLAAVAPERLRPLTTDSLALDIMGGPRWSLDADLAAGRWLTAAHKVLMRSASFVPTSAARVLLPHQSDGDPTGEFFDREGTALAQCVLALVLCLLARPAAYEHLIGDERDRPPEGGGSHVVAWADAFGTSSEVADWLAQFQARVRDARSASCARASAASISDAATRRSFQRRSSSAATCRFSGSTPSNCRNARSAS